MFETVDIGGAQNKLKRLVRNYDNHFNCLLEISSKCTYFDDICAWLRESSNLQMLQQVFKDGCFFFTMYELCESPPCAIGYNMAFSIHSRLQTDWSTNYTK